MDTTVIDGAHYLSVVSERMNDIPHLSIMLSSLCVTANKVTSDLSPSGIYNALPNSHLFNWLAYILYYYILYYTFLPKLHIMLYLFFTYSFFFFLLEPLSYSKVHLYWNFFVVYEVKNVKVVQHFDIIVWNVFLI